MPNSKISTAGWNINTTHGNLYGPYDDPARNRAWLLGWLEKLRPGFVLCLGGLDPRRGNENIVIAIRDTLAKWGGVVAYRHYEKADEAALWLKRSPQEHMDFLQHEVCHGINPHIWLTVGNEPVTGDDEAHTRRMSKWYAELIREADRRGLWIAAPNIGGAVVTTASIYGGWFDEMLTEFVVRHNKRVYVGAGRWVSQFIFTGHEYGPAILSQSVDGEWMDDHRWREHLQPETWKTPGEVYDDDMTDNWHLGTLVRFWSRMYSLAERMGIQNYGPPDGACTESGWDRIPDMERNFPKAQQLVDSKCVGGKQYGAPTLYPYWEWAFEQQGWDGARALCEQRLWRHELRKPLGYWIGDADFQITWHTPNDERDWYRLYNPFTYTDDWAQLWADEYVPYIEGHGPRPDAGKPYEPPQPEPDPPPQPEPPAPPRHDPSILEWWRQIVQYKKALAANEVAMYQAELDAIDEKLANMQ